MNDAMRSLPATCEWLELYALGGGEPDENDAFEQHLRTCRRCRQEMTEVAGDLFLTVAEHTPRVAIANELRANLRKRPDVATVFEVRGVVAKRSAAMEWQPAGLPGVWAKTLSVDPGRDCATSLVKLDPGAVYPAHRHASLEEALVIEGDLHLHSHVLGPGDYCRAEPGSLHSPSFTERGCILLVMGSMSDELLPAEQ